MKNNRQDGYIAISAAIVLSILVMAVAGAMGGYSFTTRNNVVDFANKRASYGAARSCLDQALLKLAEDSNYAGGETFQVGEDECEVVSVAPSGQNSVIKARSEVNGSATNLQLTVVISTLSTVSLEELVKF